MVKSEFFLSHEALCKLFNVFRVHFEISLDKTPLGMTT